jgi:hypothetical protein
MVMHTGLLKGKATLWKGSTHRPTTCLAESAVHVSDMLRENSRNSGAGYAEAEDERPNRPLFTPHFFT